ncbi:conserved Plasmodium protein, unknown function [Plasmodium relictum]|uniref:Uncharacterized protein n=1 Tax=Plasmodium relictum TaxID=85471 RepID=A0A1J1H9J7_PLARL|nr:conserved Plasmodium protein, unknown function [Plasmodium relictum]CRH01596.1 conserved Plasmodium protein, unknown function [Plasmodium relictum]
MNSSLNNENENNYFVISFFESLSNFIKNVKIEIKDTFELLNYPCVYQNCKKKFSVNENEDFKNSLTTNVISKVDKKNIENFRAYKKELHNMLQDVKIFNEKYKMDMPLMFIVENLVTLHLINEYKINNIVKKIQEHNIIMPELNSDLPDYLIHTIEVDDNDNPSELIPKIRETNSLSIHNHMIKQLLENSEIKINFSKLNEINDENFFNTNRLKYISNCNVKSNDLLSYKKEEDNKIPHKKEEKNNIIENIGLSEETLKLLNLLPKKRKTDND